MVRTLTPTRPAPGPSRRTDRRNGLPGPVGRRRVGILTRRQAEGPRRPGLGRHAPARSLSSPFTTFPLAFLGSSVTNSTSLGTL